MCSARVVFALTLFACGHRGDASGPGAAKGTVTARLPSGPPLVTPGERITYRLSLKGFELAVFSLAVGDVVDLDGTPAVVVQCHAKSVGLADMVAAVDDRFTSWIDVETGRSRRFQTDEYETGSKTNLEHVLVDLAARDNDMIPVLFNVNDEEPVSEPQKASFPDTWDYNAFLIALRSWEAEPGTTTTLEVFRSRFLWRIDVEIRGRETLVTELGELPALRFDGHAVKLDRKGGKFPDTDERDFSIWISDDDGRVPLRLKARTDYGAIEMTIVDYTEGTGQRLRP